MDDHIYFVQLGEVLDAIWSELHHLEREVAELDKPQSEAIEKSIEESIRRLKALHAQMSIDLSKTATGLQVMAAAVREVTQNKKPPLRLVKR